MAAVRQYRDALPQGAEVLWYRIQDVLGQGTFGTTYLAEDLNDGRIVAIKEYLPPQVARRGEEQGLQPLSDVLFDDYAAGLGRFIAEAENLYRFDHPHIVRLVDLFEANNTAYLVMEYEEGENLQSILARRATLSEHEILRLLFPLLDALEALHDQQFAHRDVKPSNIFIRQDGSPVLLDFGSARQIAPAEAHPLTNLVSPGFAPIEQYSSIPEKQGPWTDIYALGATLYRAVTGAIPAQATARAEALVHGGSDPHAPASECAAGLYSEGLLNAIDWALQFRSQDRPQSIADWRRAFDTGSEGWRAGDPSALVYKPQATNDEAPTEPGQPSTAPVLHALVSHHNSYGFARAGEGRRPERRTERRDRRRHAAVGILRAHWALAAALIGLCIGLAGMLAGPVRDPGQPPPKAAATPQPLAETTPLRPPTAGGSDLGWSDTFDVYGLEGGTEPISKPQPEDLPAAPDPRDTVQGLLQGAREDLRAYRLTIPEGENAYDKYRQVLALEPGSRAAAEGIRSILDRYLALVYQEIEANHLVSAQRLLSRAASISPEAHRVTLARRALFAKRYGRSREETTFNDRSRSGVDDWLRRMTSPRYGNGPR
ncbi:MAG: serine/threonine protein kinase [Gammaproteobacteria bacterium]|nr:serine/threonine protein kinase [Gammaproteobacteria bacterium]